MQITCLLWHGWRGSIVLAVVAALLSQAKGDAPPAFARDGSFLEPALTTSASRHGFVVPIGHSRGVDSVAFSPDGTLVASGHVDNTVRLWRAQRGTVLRTLTGHKGGVTSVAFSPDGKVVVSGSEDDTVRLWDVQTGAVLRTLSS